MSLTTDSMSAADLAAITGNRNDGFGGEGGAFWIIMLFLFAMFGGWGGNRGFGGNGSNGDFGLYPWMNNSQNVNNGFRDQMIFDNINGIRDGVYALGPQLCNGFAGVTATVNNGFAQAEIAANARQMADMNQMFGFQTAVGQGFNATQAQLAQASADNRLGIADLKYTVATENCADRNQSMLNTRDIISAIQSGDQKIMDKLCQLELDGLKADNANLRTQLNFANLQASQVAQTAELRQSGATQLNQLVSELRSCPIPAQPVYGSQPIFTCGGNSYGCSGCGA